MATDTNRPEVIDSDGHVVEPDSLWKEYAEPEFREQLDVPGGGWVQATGITRGYPDLGTALPGSSPDADEYWADAAMGESWEEEARTKMGRPGGYDPNARLVDMDDEGIDVAVLYPTAMLTWVEEADVFGAACRAYNNWLRDYCSAAPTPPLRRRRSSRSRTSTRRSSRCAAACETSAFKAVMIRPAAYIGDEKLNHPDYDPFWAAAAELGCPIGVHPSPHGDMLNACRLLGLADGVDEPERRPRAPAGPHERDRPPDGDRPTSRSAASASGTRSCAWRSSKAPADGWCRCSSASTTSSRSSAAPTNARCRASCSRGSAW